MKVQAENFKSPSRVNAFGYIRVYVFLRVATLGEFGGGDLGCLAVLSRRNRQVITNGGGQDDKREIGDRTYIPKKVQSSERREQSATGRHTRSF